MKTRFFSIGEVVQYFGKLYRIMGQQDGRFYLRLCGWECGHGQWGWDGYGRPLTVDAWANPSGGFLSHP